MVTKSGTDEIPFYLFLLDDSGIPGNPRKNPFCIPFLIINQAIETHLRRSSRVRTSSKGFFKRKNGGERGCRAFARSDGLLEAECTTAVASRPRSPRFCAAQSSGRRRRCESRGGSGGNIRSTAHSCCAHLGPRAERASRLIGRPCSGIQRLACACKRCGGPV